MHIKEPISSFMLGTLKVCISSAASRPSGATDRLSLPSAFKFYHLGIMDIDLPEDQSLKILKKVVSKSKGVATSLHKIKHKILKRSSESTSRQKLHKNSTKKTSNEKNDPKITPKDQNKHKLVLQDKKLLDGLELSYISKGKTLLTGSTKGRGILCSHCNEVVSATMFESHAGKSKSKKPYQHIFLKRGMSLHQYAYYLKLNSQKMVENNDLLCMVCQKTGDLVFCDGCPRSFHKECMSDTIFTTEKHFCKPCQLSMKCLVPKANVVKDGAVSGPKVNAMNHGTVSGPKDKAVKDGTVSGPKGKAVNDGTVSEPKVKDGTVSKPKGKAVNDGTVSKPNCKAVNDVTVSGPKVNDGTVYGPKVKDGTVSGPKVKDGTVSGPKVNDGTVYGPKVKDGTVYGPKVNDGTVCGPKVKDGTIFGPKVKDGTIFGPKVKDGMVSGPKVKDGTVSGSKAIESTAKPSIQIDDPFEQIACVLCRSCEFSTDGFNDQTSIVCEQCEKEYHIGCLKKDMDVVLTELPSGNWFCTADCDSLHSLIKFLIDMGPLKAKDFYMEIVKNKLKNGDADNMTHVDMRWFVFTGKDACEEHRVLLPQGINILQDCFNPIIDTVTGEDFIPSMADGRQMGSYNFSGVYNALLTVNLKVVTAGMFTVYGREFAELSIVATSKPNQGKGYFQTFMVCLEKMLSLARVRKIVIPAATDAKDMWIKKFGFSKVPPRTLAKYRQTQTSMLAFQGTTLLQRCVPQGIVSSLH